MTGTTFDKVLLYTILFAGAVCMVGAAMSWIAITFRALAGAC